MTTVRAAIYVRISSDVDGERLGVTRQTEDCVREAARRAWAVVETYEDNDVSATRSKKRPAYERLLADIRSGHVTALVVWDVDRLTRTPRELEDIIDLADAVGLQLASVGGDFDLGSPAGRANARMKGVFARLEADQMSRRIKRRIDQKAEAGLPHGSIPYGYIRSDGTESLHPEESAVVRDAADRFLRGESLRAIAADLNGRGVPPPRPGRSRGRESVRIVRWSSTTLRQVLSRERNAGLRRHRGEVVGLGTWPAIYDEGTHDRIVARLRDPARRTTRGSTRKHLLTGIARCGREGCDGTMVVNVGRVASNGKRQPPAYVCSSCFKIRRKQADVDAVVEAAIIARLTRPDSALRIATSGGDADPDALDAQIAAIEARMDLVVDEYAANPTMTPRQFARLNARLQDSLDKARRERDALAPDPTLVQLVGPTAADVWPTLALEVKRAAIEKVLRVTVLPVGPGRTFDPASVLIEDELSNPPFPS